MTRPFSPLAAVAAGVVFACIALAAPPAVEHEAPKSAYSPKVAAASEEGQKAIARLKLPAGASAHLWAAEPLLANPVAFAFDSAGKCYVAETFRLGTGVSDNRGHMYWLDDDLASRTVEDRVAMYRKHLGPKFADWEKQHDRVKMVADTKGTGTADSASVFADGFRAAADGLGSGVMAHAGSVYYTCIPNLWKLSDTKGTGTADVKQSLSYGYGVHVAFIGHDSHGLRMGPDGRVYFSIGDRGVNITTKEGRHLFYPDCGAVLRCEPDGSDLEVVHYGLRNPQELAFDKHGNLFTGDNNSDSGDRARWVCIAEGADSGWRIGYQYDTTYGNRGPWNAEKIWHLQTDDQPQNTLPPLEHIGNGPSGLCYNPGVGLPKDWDDHFFLADFRGEAGGSGIWGISVKPKGASFSVNKPKQFVWSTLVTDCDFGPDGFFWSDWVSGWGQTGKGRIYRLDFAAEKDKPQFAETKKLLNDGFEKRPTAELAQLLGHADQRVRMGAQFVLAARGADGLGALAAAAKSAPDLLTRLHGIWGVGQVGRRDPSAFAHVAGLLADADAEVRAQAAKVLGDAKVPAHAAELVRLAADPEARVRFFAAQSLGKLAPLADPATQARAVAALTKLLDPADDRYLRHAAVFALSKLPVAEPAGASANVRLGTLLALRRRQSAEVVKYLDDADPRVVAEAVRAVHDEPIPAGLPKLAAMLARPQLADAVGFRALNANFHIGQPANALAVAQFAGRADQTERLRVEALQMLETWDKPGRRDRVTGLTASLPPRDGKAAADAVRANLGGIFAGPDKVRSAAAKVASKFGIKEVGPTLLALLEDAARPADTRAEALAALESLKDERTDAAVALGLASDAAELRVVARNVSARRTPDKALALLQSALADGTNRDKQGALATLGWIKSDKAKGILAEWLDRLDAGGVPPELTLDVLEAAAAAERRNPRLRAGLAAFEKKRSPADHLAAWRESQAGGDAANGRRLFANKAELSCVRCHKVDNVGGEVGPALNGIGSKQTREYLLESIVAPNKQIAKGFETVVLTLADGKTVTGVLKSEDAKEVRLVTADGQAVGVKKSDIDERVTGRTAMPEDLTKYLSKREMRDLVEYLVSLK